MSECAQRRCVCVLHIIKPSFYPSTSSTAHAVSVPILHPRERTYHVDRTISRPADDAMCEVTLGVILVSLLRLACEYDARSRCHSLVLVA